MRKMGESMKVVHITDLHIGYPHCTDVMKRVVSQILEKFQPGDTAIVVSGDIGDTARDLDLALQVLQPLHNFPIFIIPGNHDYGSGPSMYWKNVVRFDDRLYAGRGEFPKVATLGNVTFIGLDSMREKFYWDTTIDFDSNEGRLSKPKTSAEGLQGCLGMNQRDRLEEELKKVPAGNKTVVYLHHDPTYVPSTGGIGMELLDRVRFQDLAKKYKVTAVLCGHSHHFHDDSAWGVDDFFNGGTSGDKDEKYLVKLRWLDTATGKVDVIEIDTKL